MLCRNILARPVEGAEVGSDNEAPKAIDIMGKSWKE